ncbi:MAG: LuxR C-terminal-related transcriptional regulator [Dehalococcoidia bacterium]
MEGPQTRERLTPREEEVLGQLRCGLTDAQIAERLGVSRSAVSKHVSEIIGKLGVRNRHEAAYYPERPPWWLALMPPFLHGRGGPLAAAGAAAAFATVLGSLGLLAFLLTRGGGGSDGNDALVDGTLQVPQSAITALENIAFTTTLDVSAAGGDFHLTFDGAFKSPDRIDGLLAISGEPYATLFEQGLQRPTTSEITVIGERAWWREPGGEWQRGVEPGDSNDILVTLRQYATPGFYLQAFRFDSVTLPVAGEETVNGSDAYHVRLDKPALLDLLPQGTTLEFYPDQTPQGSEIFPSELQYTEEKLPADFTVDVWFARDTLTPAKLTFAYSIGPDDPTDLAFGFEPPMTMRAEMNIVDPNAEAQIEPPIAIVPSPTTPPDATIPVLTEEAEAQLREIAERDPRVQEILGGRPYEVKGPGVWHSSNLRFLGGVVTIEVADAFTYEGAWPTTIYDESLDPPFEEIEVHFRAEQIEKLSVFVYLPGERVVKVDPEGAVITSYTPPLSPQLLRKSPVQRW